jgi:hypothetical protein
LWVLGVNRPPIGSSKSSRSDTEGAPGKAFALAIAPTREAAIEKMGALLAEQALVGNYVPRQERLANINLESAYELESGVFVDDGLK